MYDDLKTATEDQFYYELINRFFNPKSYFYYCIATYLNRPSLITHNPEASTTKLISQLIDFLIKSKKTIADLKEITHIKGFESTYKNIENQILRYDIKSLDQIQGKKAINKIALSFLRDTYQALSTNPKSGKTLILYIEIKSQLRNLLFGSNGKHKKSNPLKTIESNSTFSDNSQIQLSNEPSNFTTQNSCSEPGNDHSKDLKNETQDRQFKREMQNSSPQPEQERGGNFEINTSFKEFNISEDRSTDWINTPDIFSGLLTQSNSSQDGNDEIVIPGDDDDEELLKLIQEIDSYKDSIPLKNFSDIKEMNKAKSLDIPLMENLASPGQTKGDENSESKTAPDNELEPDKEQGVFFDEPTIKLFQQEAVLYYKILSNAVMQLKSDDKIQSALEDIELASSSLEHLAQKFGMEKLALLPELMESISNLANKHIITPPIQIIQGIEDGVNLLKEFDVNKTDHRAKFMSILMLLKEYYIKMLNTTRKFPASL